MDIGIKLDIGFSTHESVRSLFGGKDPLPVLRERGIRAVETAISPETEFAALSAYTRVCNEAGFHVSLHPYTERTPYNPVHFGPDDERCRRFHATVFLAAEDAGRRQGHEVVVNIHAAAGGKDEDRGLLLARSVRFFAWAKQWCLENAPLAKPVVELQFRAHPHETIQRIGDEYGEIAEIARRAEVGVCWDFGHAYMNARRFETPLDPPDDLLPAITHIHCHDVNEIDHYPLVCDRVPWERMLGLARQNGFDQTVILEVPPERFLVAGGFETLVRSIERIKAVTAEKLGA
jgi:sugar phosphate isomerase/epimerase